MSTPDTRIRSCNSCSAAIIWLVTSTGRKMPTNPEGVTAQDWYFDPKRHVSHFATCPNANKHRKPPA